MSWFLLDDKAAFHAKVVRAGNQAYGAWCRAGSWSSDHLTDGFIPDEIAKLIEPDAAQWEKLRICGGKGKDGLVEASDGGWQIHDFLSKNPSRASILGKRQAEAERKANWRERKDTSKRAATPHVDVSRAVSHVTTPDLSTSYPPPCDLPVPDLSRPSPSPSPSHTSEREGERAHAIPIVGKPDTITRDAYEVPGSLKPDQFAYGTGQELGFSKAQVDEECQRMIARFTATPPTRPVSNWQGRLKQWLLDEKKFQSARGGGKGKPPIQPLIGKPAWMSEEQWSAEKRKAGVTQ